LENSKKSDSNRFWRLSEALAALANKMEPQAAAEIAKGLAAASENSKKSDSNELFYLSNALATLINKAGPQTAAKIARPVARQLASALENPQESSSDQLSRSCPRAGGAGT
jgi:hypothetical protein